MERETKIKRSIDRYCPSSHYTIPYLQVAKDRD